MVSGLAIILIGAAAPLYSDYLALRPIALPSDTSAGSAEFKQYPLAPDAGDESVSIPRVKIADFSSPDHTWGLRLYAKRLRSEVPVGFEVMLLEQGMEKQFEQPVEFSEGNLFLREPLIWTDENRVIIHGEWVYDKKSHSLMRIPPREDAIYTYSVSPDQKYLARCEKSSKNNQFGMEVRVFDLSDLSDRTIYFFPGAKVWSSGISFSIAWLDRERFLFDGNHEEVPTVFLYSMTTDQVAVYRSNRWAPQTFPGSPYLSLVPLAQYYDPVEELIIQDIRDGTEQRFPYRGMAHWLDQNHFVLIYGNELSIFNMNEGFTSSQKAISNDDGAKPVLMEFKEGTLYIKYLKLRGEGPYYPVSLEEESIMLESKDSDITVTASEETGDDGSLIFKVRKISDNSILGSFGYKPWLENRPIYLKLSNGDIILGKEKIYSYQEKKIVPLTEGTGLETVFDYDVSGDNLAIVGKGSSNNAGIAVVIKNLASGEVKSIDTFEYSGFNYPEVIYLGWSDGKLFYDCFENKPKIKVYSLQHDRAEVCFEGAGEAQVSPDGSKIVFTQIDLNDRYDSEIVLFNLKSNQKITTLEGSRKIFWDNDYLIIKNVDQAKLVVYDIKDKGIKAGEYPFEGQPYAVKVTDDGLQVKAVGPKR